jgi:hypothetical protein
VTHFVLSNRIDVITNILQNSFNCLINNFVEILRCCIFDVYLWVGRNVGQCMADKAVNLDTFDNMGKTCEAVRAGNFLKK